MKKTVTILLTIIMLQFSLTLALTSAALPEEDDPYFNIFHPYWQKDNPNGYWARFLTEWCLSHRLQYVH